MNNCCIAIAFLVACVACSPEEQASTAPKPPAKHTERIAKITLCDLVPSEQVETALGGKLLVKGIDGANEFNCVYKLDRPSGPALEGASLIVHKVQPAMYFAEKQQHEGKDWYEPLDGVGREAYVLNQAQVNALVDDDTAIRLGLMVLVIGDPIIPKAEARTGVVTLATDLVSRL